MTGVDFVLTHLDGKKIRIKNVPGEVIKPNEIKTVLEKGLPFHKQSFKFGNLYVIFKITFPSSLNAPSLKLLESSLSTMKRKEDDVDMEV